MQTPTRIFLVDDEPFYLSLYQKHLEKLGQSDIHLFTNGMDCLNALSQDPGLIFLDQCMAPVNGIETLRKIKRFDPNILVVFISGQEDMTVAINALKYGALDYLVKGRVTAEQLRAVLDRASAIRMLTTGSNTRALVKKGIAALTAPLAVFVHKLILKP